MKGFIYRGLRRLTGVVLCASLLAGSIPAPAFAAEDGAGADAVGEMGAQILSDGSGAQIAVLDEDGNVVSPESEAYSAAVDKYNAFFSQLDGRTFDASDADMTDFIIGQMNEKEGIEEEDRAGADTSAEDNTTVSQCEAASDAAGADSDAEALYGGDERLFAGARPFADAATHTAIQLNNPVTEGGKTTWDCVWFGSRLKDAKDDEKAFNLVKWRVLEVKDDKALLICDGDLGDSCFKYINDKSSAYKGSYIERYLNKSVMNSTFSPVERSVMCPVSDRDTIGLPSMEMLSDSAYGFGDNASRSLAREYWITDLEGGLNCYITKEGDKKTVDKNDAQGSRFRILGRKDSIPRYAIRPVIRVDLTESTVVESAGQVCSDGTVKEKDPSSVREIKLDPCGGSVEYTSIKIVGDRITKGGNAEALPEARMENMDFSGWYDKKEGGNIYKLGSTVPDDVDTLYAHYDRKLTGDDFRIEGEKMEVALPSGDIPFLSKGLSFDFAGLSASIDYDRTEHTYEVGIGFDIVEVKENVKENGFNPKKYFGGAAEEMEENITKAMEALGKARDTNLSKPFKVSGETSPAFTIMGYAEGTYDEKEGLSAPTTGRICMGFELYYEGQWQTAIVFIPVTIKLKFGGSGTVTLEIEKREKGSGFDLAGMATIIFPDIELRAGIGVAYVASIGVYGAAQSVLDMRFDGDFSGKWSLKGEAGGYVTFLFIDYKKCFIRGEKAITQWGEYYKNKGDSDEKDRDGAFDMGAGGEYSVIRTGERVQADWYGGDEANADRLDFDQGDLSKGRVRLLKNMFNNPMPRIVQTRDTVILSFMAEDAEDPTGNHTDAYYSVWDKDGEKWNKPENLDSDNDTAEFYPALAACGDEIRAVWMDAGMSVSADEAVLLESMRGDLLSPEQSELISSLAGSIEIKTAKFDKEAGRFTGIETLGAAGGDSDLDIKPKIGYAQGIPWVAWLSDSNTGLLSPEKKTDSGKETIEYAFCEDGTWKYGSIAPGNVSITGLNIGELEGKAAIVYGVDEDRSFETQDDVSLWMVYPGVASEGVRLSEEGCCAMNPQFAHIGEQTAVIWYETGKDGEPLLKYSHGSKGVKSVHFQDASALSPDFIIMDDQVFTDPDKELCTTVVVCAALNGEDRSDDNRRACVYVIDEACDEVRDSGYDVDAGFPISIKHTGEYGSVGQISGFWYEDAGEGEVSDLVLVYPETRADFDTDEGFGLNTSLYMTSVISDMDLEITDGGEVQDVEPEDIEYGEEIELDINVKNTGLEDMYSVRAIVTYSGKVIGDEVMELEEALEPGDTASLTAKVKLPEDVVLVPGAEFELKLLIPDKEGEKDPDESDNIIRYNAGDANLVLTQEVESADGTVSVNYVIENTSVFDVKGRFTLCTKDEEGKDIPVTDPEEVEVSAKSSVTLSLDDFAVSELADYGDILYARIETDSQESYTTDNDDFFRVSEAFVDKVELSQTQLQLERGESRALAATITPAELTQTGICWISTDESVAVVDRNGKVTAVSPGEATVIAAANDCGGAQALAQVLVTGGDYAADGDTDVLTEYKNAKGKTKGYQLSLSENAARAVITVAKGNKFIIANAVKGSFEYTNPADKKLVSVNKKGVVKAKKPADGVVISYTDSRTNAKAEVTVRVREMKFANEKKLSATVSANAPFDLTAELLRNATVDMQNDRYKKVIPDLKIEKDKKGVWHVTGTPVKKGGVNIPVYVYGKKFALRVKAK